MSINPDKAKFYTSLVLTSILSGGFSFDAVYSELVRKYKLSPRESVTYYKLIYKVLVYYHTLRFLASYHGFKPRVSGIIEYLYLKGFDLNAILEESRNLSSTLSPVTRLAVLYGYPSWLVRDLYGRIPYETLEEILRSLNERKRWIRVNTAKVSIEKAMECLEKTGIRVKKHSKYQEVLLVEDPYVKIGGNECFEKGLIIPQDISSYIATKLIEGNIGDFVDACSAPGVKLMQVYGENIARRYISVDLNLKRIKQAAVLFNKFLENPVRTIFINSDSTTIALNLHDPVTLIDAPCSNSGAVYSDPAVKIHLSRRRIKKLSLVQKRLVENALKYSRRIYYMTCSIHPLEGEEVVDYILKRHRDKIHLEVLYSEFLSKGYSGYESSSRVYRIYPHVVNGQGFFIALLEVKAK